MIRKTALTCLALGLFPALAVAQIGESERVGPSVGDRELTLAGTGTSDRKFDTGNFGISGDLGWYVFDRNLLLGVRQSVNYANIEGADISDDFWNGSTRGFANYHFFDDAWRPFLGASLGVVYGDGVDDTGFGGLELGLKYYVLDSTFVMGRAEYQFFFERARDVDDNFDEGAWAYTVGLGYNF